MKKALHFGAGNIGRGFIGAILFRSGYQVTFADVNETVIDELNRQQAYDVKIASDQGETLRIEQVSGIHSSTQREKLNEAIAEADLITISVGPSILRFVAKDLQQGLDYAISENKLTPKNIVACENMINGTDQLKTELFNLVSSDRHDLLNESIGFPNSAVDRIVPIQQNDNPLTVQVEPFFEWVVEAPEWKGDIPEMDGVQFVEDLAPFIERKLLTVNAGHAAIAYVGSHYGFTTIDAAIADTQVRETVEKTLGETSRFLIEKHGLNPDEHQQYVKKIIGRFENPHLSDDVTRVGRSPIRKLSPNERLTYPALALHDAGHNHDGLTKTIACALAFSNGQDEEAVQLQQSIRENGVAHTIATIIQRDQNDAFIQEITEAYNSL